MKATISGQSAELDCDVDRVLNHQFLRVHFVGSEVPKESKDPRYEAMVFIGYDNMSERYVAHWLDTFGGGRFSEVLGFGTRIDDGAIDQIGL